MGKYEVTFSRVYEVEAADEEEAKNVAYMEFDVDIELGFAVACEDSFSAKIKKI